jgi:hypothetical protein
MVCIRRSIITEYGRVITDDKRKDVRETRWFYTLNRQWFHIDGNPSHPLNGGVTGLAENHCLGSFANHSTEWNSCYVQNMRWATPRAILELAESVNACPWSCMVLVASQDIHRHQQISSDYQKNTASGMAWVHFANETLSEFVLNARDSLRSPVEGVKKWFIV